MEEGGARADWGSRDGGESDSAALPPKDSQGGEERDEEAPKRRSVDAAASALDTKPLIQGP